MVNSNPPWWIQNLDDPKSYLPSSECPNCNSKGLIRFYGVTDIPVNSCLMMKTKGEARDIPQGDLSLGFCEKCGFITNTSFSNVSQRYTTMYEDQQSYSPTFNTFAEGLARRLIDKYDLHNKHLVEIGCSKGDFLIMMCKMGNNSGTGIDPSSIPGRVTGEGAERVTFIQEYYSEKHSDVVGDMIMCRHTLEHIHKTREFVRTVRKSIVDRTDTVVFFEVPDITRVLKETAFWDMYYEHCSYLSLGSMARLFRSCGFEVLDLDSDYDDQYLLIEARPVNNESSAVHPREETVDEMRSLINNFTASCAENLAEWNRYLAEAKKDGKTVAVWGSGSKFVSFYTTLGLSDEICHVVDINPYRHGRYVVGACMPVESPESLKKHKPDIVIIMNPVYTDEITAEISRMGLNPEIRAV